MKKSFQFFTEISKVEPQDDGSIMVYGVASSDALDSDGEITSPEAFKAALPDFFSSGPALREMHQLIAAGTVTEASVDEAGKANIAAHVVDAGSVAKVKAGVLRGFSWRGPVLKRRAGAPHILDAIKIHEISLVDRPANPEARIELYKADDPAKGVPMKLTDEGKKSLYDVAQLADLICQLNNLVEWSENEKFWEGDDSTVPEQLRLHARGLGDVLKQMATEEVTELLGTDDKQTSEGDDMTDAQKAELAEAKQAVTDLKASIPGLITAAVAEAMKAAKPTDTVTPAVVAPPAPPAEPDVASKLAKAETEKAALEARVAEAEEAVKSLTEGVKEMTSRLQAKGYLRVIEKGEDTGSPENEASKAQKNAAPTDPMAEIKAAHADGTKLRAVSR